MRRGLRLAGLAVAIAGCAAVDPTPRFEELGGLVRPLTDVPLVWERTPDEAEVVRAAVADDLAGGLTRAEAVRIALLRNRSLQATFEEVGIAEAERVQAGLLTNPSLSLVLAFPLNLGDVSATLLGLLSDAWLTPVDEAIAQRSLEATLRRVAAKVVATAAAAGVAYDEVLYWSERVELQREKLLLRRERLAAERADGRGRGSGPDAEEELSDQELSLAYAEKELAAARIGLAETLGLAEEPLPALVDALEVPPSGDWTAQTVVPFAIENRFDVAAAELDVEGAEQAVELERRRVFGEVAVGPSYQGGFGSLDGAGPALGVALPIFDQNQAGIARAEFQLRRRQRLLEDTKLRARREVLGALAEAEFRRKQAAVHAERVAAAERSARRGGGGRVSGSASPDGREKVLAARRSSLDSIAKLRRAEADLQTALWGAGAD